MASSTSTDPPVSTLGIYVDPTMSVKGNIRATHTVATAVGFIQKKVAEHVTQTYNLDPPLAPMDLRGRYFPAGKLSVQIDRFPTKCHLSPRCRAKWSAQRRWEQRSHSSVFSQRRTEPSYSGPYRSSGEAGEGKFSLNRNQQAIVERFGG